MLALRDRFKFIKKITCNYKAAGYFLVYIETIYSFTKEILVVTL